MFLVPMFLLNLFINPDLCGDSVGQQDDSVGPVGDAVEQHGIKEQIEDLQHLGLSVADLLEVDQLTQTVSQHDMDTLAELLDRQGGSGLIFQRIQNILKFLSITISTIIILSWWHVVM